MLRWNFCMKKNYMKYSWWEINPIENVEIFKNLLHPSANFWMQFYLCRRLLEQIIFNEYLTVTCVIFWRKLYLIHKLTIFWSCRKLVKNFEQTASFTSFNSDFYDISFWDWDIFWAVFEYFSQNDWCTSNQIF